MDNFSDINNYFENYLDTLEKFKLTHPNIYRLWHTYLELKREKIKKDMLMLERFINNLENNIYPDLSIDNIIFLYMFLKS